MDNSIKEVNFCISYTDDREKKVKVPPDKDYQKTIEVENVPNIEIQAGDINPQVAPQRLIKQLEARHAQRIQITHTPTMRDVSKMYSKNSEDFRRHQIYDENDK